MLDYKDAIQAIFEEKVAELHDDCEYWDLPQEEQDRLFRQAQLELADRLADRADMLRDIEKERPR